MKTGCKVVLNIDGAARGNPGHAGIGAIIRDKDDEVLLSISEYIGEATNNIAEYSALIVSLQALTKFKANEVKIFSDSELLVNQLNGDYRVKNENLKIYFNEAKSLLKTYEKVEISHVERKKNKEADQLANEAIDGFLAGEKTAFALDDFPEQQQLF